MLPAASALIGLLLGYANGANDNFKGVATLFGSGTSSYRRALLWATITTGLGSVTALFLAQELLAAFSGRGLVPRDVLTDPAFPAATALAAGSTVLLATRVGLPISTTHALIGALVGVGLIASGAGIDASRLATGYALPLLTSPFLAALAAGALYLPLRYARQRLGVSQETCICVGEEVVRVVPGAPGNARVLQTAGLPTVSLGTNVTCQVRYSGEVMGLSARRILDSAHYLSAGAVSFARGLNDTPKIAGAPARRGPRRARCGRDRSRRGHGDRRADQRAASRGDDVPPGDRHQPRPGLHREPRHEPPGDRRLEARHARVHDPRLLRIPVRDRYRHAPSPMEDHREHPAGLGGHPPGRGAPRRGPRHGSRRGHVRCGARSASFLGSRSGHTLTIEEARKRPDGTRPPAWFEVVGTVGPTGPAKGLGRVQSASP